VDIIIFIAVALLILAAVGLIVGVANDAVNFLNSAVGSNSAPRIWIMIVASIGIMVGVTFSSGMMEVARKGIFDPSFFTLEDIMYVFLAVIIANILLLDFFNTFGLPTSTTVAIVFNLLGASLVVAAVKMANAGMSVFDAFTAINAPSVLKIITGIFISVVIAFIVGAIAQYLTRLIFTFDYARRMKRYGALYCAVAMTGIMYFMLLKGVSGASFMSSESIQWILQHTWVVLGIAFAIWVVVFQFLLVFTKINIFKPIVLAGTFSLAMAFAANDLVNFIGAPLAGVNAIQLAQGNPDPLHMTMEALNNKIPINTWHLLAAGVIMVLTLWINKKTRTVTRTELSLGRQDEGFERFPSTAASRGIVRAVIVFFNFISRITPAYIREKVNRRFDNSMVVLEKDANGEEGMFDVIRGSVNLMISAILISLGTTMQLPLSTTYVTFMVAMATALPDRAWGRESAVYRVSGVLTVVGGWFLTAILAALIAAAVGAVLFVGKLPAVIIMLALTVYLFYHSIVIHRRREKEHQEDERVVVKQEMTPDEAKDVLFKEVGSFVYSAGEAVYLNTKGLFEEDRNALKEAKKIAKSMNRQCKAMTTSIVHTSRLSGDDSFDQALANAIGALQRLSSTVKNLTYQSYSHIDNNHNVFNDIQAGELRQLDAKLQSVIGSAKDMSTGTGSLTLDTVHTQVGELKDLSRKFDKNQLKRTKKEKYPSRTSLLFFEILSDTNAIVDNLLILLHVSLSFNGYAPEQLRMAVSEGDPAEE